MNVNLLEGCCASEGDVADSVRIICVEDNPADVELFDAHLRAAGLQCDLVRVETANELIRECERQLPDLILVDYLLPGFDGLTALSLVRELCPEAPSIFVSGVAGEAHASKALQLGAVDYVCKQNLASLVPSIRLALRDSQMQRISACCDEERSAFLMRQADLITLSQDLLAERTLDGMLSRITLTARKVTGARSALTLYGLNGKTFDCISSSGETNITSCSRGMMSIERGGVYVGLLNDTGFLLLTDQELRAHPAWWGLPEGHPPLRGLLGVPLGDEQSAPSGMILVSDRNQGDFTAMDLMLMTHLSILASHAMRHLSAAEMLRRSNDELEARVAVRTAELRNSVTALSKEIEERRHTQFELQKSEERYALAAIGVNDGIWDWELETGKVYFSGRCKTMLGFDQGEPWNTIDDWFGRIVPEDRARVRKAVGAHISGSVRLLHCDYRIESKNGKILWMLTRGSSFRDANRQAYRMAGSHTDITGQRKAEKNLLESHRNLRNLAAHQEFLLAKERENISREIHDEIGQSLAVLKFDLHWLEKRALGQQGEFVQKLGEMRELLEMTLGTIQRIATELRPRMLYDLGLAAAIESYAADFGSRTGIECRLSLDQSCEEKGNARISALFRAFREAMTNVMRHAGASVIEVTLDRRGEAVRLTLKDDGCGITRAQIRDAKSVGLIGMRERLQQWGGRLVISGRSGQGSTVRMVMPLH